MAKHKKKNHPPKEKYPWQFWCIVCAFIAVSAFLILLASLSVKAIVQDIQLLVYENHTFGTVSAAEFTGRHPAYINDSGSSQDKFDKIHYVITFDEETSGCSQYEYRADDMIATEKYIGDRYLVLFNDIKDPVPEKAENLHRTAGEKIR